MRARPVFRKASRSGLVLSILMFVALQARAQAAPEVDDGVEPSSDFGNCLLHVEGARREHTDGLEYYGGVAFTSPFGGCAGESQAVSAPDADEPWRPNEPDSVGELDAPLRPLAGKAPRSAPGLLGASNDGVSNDGASNDWVTNDGASTDAAGEVGERAGPRLYVVSPRLARDVVAAALRASGLSAEGSRLAAAAARARWSAALPELRLRGARGFDESARVDYEGEDAGETRVTGSADLDLEVRLTWRFSELLFSGKEPSLFRMQQTLVKERRDVARVALAALLRWQRAENAVLASDATPEERAAAALLATEAELELSVLTDGWFSSEHVRGAPWPLAAPPARAGSRDEAAAIRPSSDPVASAPSGAGRGAAAPPRGPSEAKGSLVAAPQSGSAAPAEARAPGPSEAQPPGVNVPRDVGRDAKQTDGPQKAR